MPNVTDRRHRHFTPQDHLCSRACRSLRTICLLQHASPATLLPPITRFHVPVTPRTLATLLVTGRGFGKESGDSWRDVSATSTRSAPVVLERPSSRGGAAFEMQWESETARKMPRRLDRLRAGGSSNSGGGKRELSLGELQAKLESAEKRRLVGCGLPVAPFCVYPALADPPLLPRARGVLCTLKEYEARIKQKMAQASAGHRHGSAEQQAEQQASRVESTIAAKDSKAVENREAHLKKLRDRLREKEDRAREVRQRKAAAMAAAPS